MRRKLIRRAGDPPTPAAAAADGAAAQPARRSTRDRRGRGLRGPLAPPGVPIAVTRSEAFEDLVASAVERLEGRWSKELAAVDFAVAEVPGAGAVAAADAAAGRDGVPLTRLHHGRAGSKALIVVYRRPIEARATNRHDLAALVQDLLTEQVAELLGIAPETIDPDYGLD